jgi:hypothetical protein
MFNYNVNDKAAIYIVHNIFYQSVESVEAQTVDTNSCLLSVF